MNNKLHIEPYKDYTIVKYYTIRWAGEADNETDKFLSRFIHEIGFEEDIQIIVQALEMIGKRGAEDRYLRFEKEAAAIPVGTSKLRLYCIKCAKDMVILGNGGIKSSQRVQDSPDVFPHFLIMNTLEKMIRERIIEKEIWWEGNELVGNLQFDWE